MFYTESRSKGDRFTWQLMYSVVSDGTFSACHTPSTTGMPAQYSGLSVCCWVLVAVNVFVIFLSLFFCSRLGWVGSSWLVACLRVVSLSSV